MSSTLLRGFLSFFNAFLKFSLYFSPFGSPLGIFLFTYLFLLTKQCGIKDFQYLHMASSCGDLRNKVNQSLFLPKCIDYYFHYFII